MKIPLLILSICLLASVGLGPGIATGAQLLSDDDLDGVTAGGASWTVDILPPEALLGSVTPIAKPSPALTAAQASMQAAQASMDLANAVANPQRLDIASKAILTAATALDTASDYNGLSALHSGYGLLNAASAILNAVPTEQVTPAVIEAASKVNNASQVLNKASLDNTRLPLTTAVSAVQAASQVMDQLGAAGIGGTEAQIDAALKAASNSILEAKQAIDQATDAHLAELAALQTAPIIFNTNDPGSLDSDPIVRFTFEAGSIIGSGEIIPFNSNGAPLILEGATFLNGPITLIAENLMFNLNICQNCRAETIIQKNNGFVFPINVR